MSAIRIAVAGFGKIARDQHLPEIAASDRFALAAIVSTHGRVNGIPTFGTITEMVEAGVVADAVAVCTPPIGRRALVAEAFCHGLHVMIEKPPAATVSEADGFSELARQAGRSLYAAWHSRCAAGVEPARAWLADKTIRRVECVWKEDVRIWHPGQAWIWEPGIGVFDPGINALSVLTRILPLPLGLRAAELRFPENRQAPIAADLEFRHGEAAVLVGFDFDQRGPQSWDIAVETESGRLELGEGAARLAIGGQVVELDESGEYRRVYRRFAELIERGESEFDLTPFRHVADAFLLARRKTIGPFFED
jgi:D-galactose 1-dehydrogenase